MPTRATRRRTFALLALALGWAPARVHSGSDTALERAASSELVRAEVARNTVVQSDGASPPTAKDWGVARAGAARGHIEAAGFLLVHLPVSNRRAEDARVALEACLDTGHGRYARPRIDVATPEALVQALAVARAGADDFTRWAQALGASAMRSAIWRGPARFAQASSWSARAGGAPIALEICLELARQGGPAAVAARQRAFELVDRKHTEQVRHWLGEWSKLGPDAPAHPIVDSWRAMRELDELGEGRATWWMWLAAADLSVPLDECATTRAQLALRLRAYVDEPWFEGLARAAATAVHAQTRGALLELLEYAIAESRNVDVRPWCLEAVATIIATTEPVDAEAAALIYDRIATEHPDHELAAAARIEAWALRHLRVGLALPAFDRPDVLGRTLDLSTRRGRTFVLVFLETGVNADPSLFSVLDQLTTLYPRERFEVVAVSVDVDVEAAKQRHVESRREWEVSWQGSRAGPWPAAFGLRSFPTTFVVDASGTIRARDVFGAALSRAVFDVIGARSSGG